jgi:two-component system chemotaxis response regulator CheB
MRLNFGPRINFVRPAIDPLFRSAAQEYEGRAVGIILSGGLDDGVAGLMAIQRRGGKAIVQKPEDAAVPEMPENALRNIKPDFVLSVSEMPAVLMKILSQQGLGDPPQSMDEIGGIRNVIADNRSQQEQEGRKGQIVPFTCPECGGPLWQVDEPGMATFACHVGHVLEGHKLL